MECTIDDVAKLGLKVGTITSAEPVEGSEKLLKLMVDLGDQSTQILAGLAKVYSPEELVQKQVVVVSNLAPRTMMGLDSNGMVLCANGIDGPVILNPLVSVPSGASVQ